MAAAGFVLLEDRGVLAVSGPDRLSFLQGLVSNDVAKVGPTAARYAALLGLENYYRENDGKTGYMLLIDAQSKKLFGKITKLNSTEEIKTMLTQAIAGRSSGD